MNNKMENIDHPAHILQIRSALDSNPFLRELYKDIYRKYAAVLNDLGVTPSSKIIELGAGGSFLKSVVFQTKYTDIIPYEGIDLVVNALDMPFEDSSVDSFFMMNVVHHVPNAEGLFLEINRCLRPGGVVFIFDQNVNLFSRFIYKNLHHEGFDDLAENWSFESTGPLSSANGALAWILFCRDRDLFKKKFPALSMESIRTSYPWSYWLSGGLSRNSRLPSFLFRISTIGESILSSFFRNSGSFLEVVLRKV